MKEKKNSNGRRVSEEENPIHMTFLRENPIQNPDASYDVNQDRLAHQCCLSLDCCLSMDCSNGLCSLDNIYRPVPSMQEDVGQTLCRLHKESRSLLGAFQMYLMSEAYVDQCFL